MPEANRALYLTRPEDCHYLPGRLAQNLVLDPHIPLNSARYQALMSMGFRRSGDVIYRPHCQHCRLCVPLRIDAQRFRPNRSQKRNLKRNQAIVLHSKPAAFDEQHFDLYTRYLNTRHPDSTMSHPSREDFCEFLLCRWQKAHFLEQYLDGTLVAVTVFDPVPDGLSAVYSFYTPELSGRALGIHAILQLIRLALSQEQRYVYLGYWIQGAANMAYKTHWDALEAVQPGAQQHGWQDFIPRRAEGSQ